VDHKLASALCVVLISSACGEGAPVGGPHLAVSVAPLQLDAIGGACYDLAIANGLGQPVVTLGDPAVSFPNDPDTLCSGRFGNGPGGAISYIAPCDGQEPEHSVTLWVDQLLGPGGQPLAPGTWQNPCAPARGGCTLEALCVENADSPVTFNLTIMRDAVQGFFDVAVNFDDVFCSAKVDCTYDAEGQRPIELLFNGPERDQTAVVALACTGGAGEDTATELHVNDVRVECGVGSGSGSGQLYTQHQLVPFMCSHSDGVTEVYGAESRLQMDTSTYEVLDFANDGVAWRLGEGTWSVARIVGPDGWASVVPWAPLSVEGQQIAIAMAVDAASTAPVPDISLLLRRVVPAIIQKGVDGWQTIQVLDLPSDVTNVGPQAIDPTTNAILAAEGGQQPVHPDRLYLYIPTTSGGFTYGAPRTVSPIPGSECDPRAFSDGLLLANCGSSGPFVVRTDDPDLTPLELVPPTVVEPEGGQMLAYASESFLVAPDLIMANVDYTGVATSFSSVVAYRWDGSEWNGTFDQGLLGGLEYPRIASQSAPGFFVLHGELEQVFVQSLVRATADGWDTWTALSVESATPGWWSPYGVIKTNATGREILVGNSELGPFYADLAIGSGQTLEGRALPLPSADATDFYIQRLLPLADGMGVVFEQNEILGVWVWNDTDGVSLVASKRFESATSPGETWSLVSPLGGNNQFDARNYGPTWSQCGRVLAMSDSDQAGYAFDVLDAGEPIADSDFVLVADAGLPKPPMPVVGGGGGHTQTVLNPALPEGNAWSSPGADPDPLDAVWQYAVYHGNEQLTCNDGPCNKLYWNVAVGFDPGVANCWLAFEATASEATQLSGGATPERTTWPILRYEVQLTGEGGGLVCTQNPLNASTGVTTSYTDPEISESFCYSFDGGAFQQHCEVPRDYPLISRTPTMQE